MVAVAVAVAVVGAGAVHGGAGAADETEVVGTVVEGHGDDFDAGISVDHHYGLQTDSGVFRLELPAGAQVAPGQQVRLRGRFAGETFVVAAGGDDGADGGGETTGGTALADAATMRSLAVLLVNFSNDTRQPWTHATVRGVVFDGSGSVNAYYQDASDGQVGFAGDVHGWYTIPADNTGCAYGTWATQARAAAADAGVNLSGYQHVMYAFPKTSSCSWSGLAYLSGGTSFINGAMALRTVSHELGHNLGVHHAASLSCTSGGSRVTLSDTCTMSEYGDPFTVMGASSTRLHHNWHRSQMKFPNEVQTVTTGGEYRLAPADGPGTPRLLSVARADGTFYQLEYRQPTGVFDTFSSTDPAVRGVTLRVAPSPTKIVQSKLLDTTPETSGFGDAPLAVGRTFVDPATGMRITTMAVSSEGATVVVGFEADTQAPSAPGNLTATATGPGSVALAWTAATDDVGVAAYRVLRDGTQVATTAGTTHTDTGLAGGTTYGYQVVAVDAAGNVGPAAVASATTWVPDTQAPTAPTGLKATVGKGGSVALAWTASTDDVGVAGYRVLQNGTQVADVPGTTARVKARKGTHTFTVVAHDRAGNVSPPSSGVTVKV